MRTNNSCDTHAVQDIQPGKQSRKWFEFLTTQKWTMNEFQWMGNFVSPQKLHMGIYSNAINLYLPSSQQQQQFTRVAQVKCPKLICKASDSSSHLAVAHASRCLCLSPTKRIGGLNGRLLSHNTRHYLVICFEWQGLFHSGYRLSLGYDVEWAE